MKIALLGNGKMGQMVEAAAKQRGHAIVATITRGKITPNLLKDAQVCIDFSHPECVLDHIQAIAMCNKPLIMGTTGWTDYLDEAKRIVLKSNIGFLYSPNFSIGVALFFRLVQSAAQLIDPFANYDVGLFEAHHNQKADAPSGTAKALKQIINQAMKTRSSNLPEISSIRCGSIPGTHSVIFDSPADTITLTHEARNREGFANGAITAAEWIQNRKGFFTLEDMLTSLENRKTP